MNDPLERGHAHNFQARSRGVTRSWRVQGEAV